MRVITVQVDNREKRPLLFPSTIRTWKPGKKAATFYKVKVESVRMVTGDYRLKGKPLLVERKGSISELLQNVTPPDLPRFRKAIRRLGSAAIKNKETPNILLLCVSPRHFRPSVLGWKVEGGRSIRTSIDGEFVLGRLLEEIEDLPLDMWIVGSLTSSGQRRDVGRLLLHRLVRQ